MFCIGGYVYKTEFEIMIVNAAKGQIIYPAKLPPGIVMDEMTLTSNFEQSLTSGLAIGSTYLITFLTKNKVQENDFDFSLSPPK